MLGKLIRHSLYSGHISCFLNSPTSSGPSPHMQCALTDSETNRRNHAEVQFLAIQYCRILVGAMSSAG